MILDTSAIVSVVMAESDAEQMLTKLEAASRIAVGAPTMMEAGIVLSARMGMDARGILTRMVDELSLIVVPFDEPHYAAAMDAWQRFGRGRHSAALNMGDCMSYAIARVSSEPLLCKGNDFAQTDLDLA